MPYLTLNDIELYYERYGDNKNVLLLVHGLGSSGKDWEYQIKLLSQHFTVIVPDLRGHGKTTKRPETYTVSLFAQDLKLMLDALEIKQCHLLGISMGAMVAYQFAVDYPHIPLSLIAVNALPELKLESLTNKFKLYSRLAIIRFLGLKALGGYLAKKLFPQSEHAHLRQTLVERWQENDKTCYLNALSALIGWSIVEKIDTIRIPSMAIGAEFDYTSSEQKHEFVQRMKNARFVEVKNTHHALPAENPDEFNRIVLDFYRSQGLV